MLAEVKKVNTDRQTGKKIHLINKGKYIQWEYCLFLNISIMEESGKECKYMYCFDEHNKTKIE